MLLGASPTNRESRFLIHTTRFGAAGAENFWKNSYFQGGRGDGDPHPHPHGGGDGDGVGMKFSQVGIPTCKILPFQILIQIKNCNSNKNLKKSDFFVEFFF